MLNRTRSLWEKQDKHSGDRLRFFRALREYVQANRVLYPGSYVDVGPSFSFPDVTYVDIDRRAAAFFTDRDGVRELIDSEPGSPVSPEFAFIHADYNNELAVPGESFDLLVSLYAGFISLACTEYLRKGGLLLVNSSHGDAAMASIDPRYRLAAVVHSESGQYRVSEDNLDTYLIPKKPTAITKEGLQESGRGVPYTKSAFAYLFKRVG